MEENNGSESVTLNDLQGGSITARKLSHSRDHLSDHLDVKRSMMWFLRSRDNV
jgi:hypothetical protein